MLLNRAWWWYPLLVVTLKVAALSKPSIPSSCTAAATVPSSTSPIVLPTGAVVRRVSPKVWAEAGAIVVCAVVVAVSAARPPRKPLPPPVRPPPRPAHPRLLSPCLHSQPAHTKEETCREWRLAFFLFIAARSQLAKRNRSASFPPRHMQRPRPICTQGPRWASTEGPPVPTIISDRDCNVETGS
jgi:hypothetical protein